MEPVVEAGDYALLPHFTYAHRFWRVEGTETIEVFPQAGTGVHLMIAFWDRQTGELLPVDAGGTMEIRHDGETVETVTPWPMLAQSMGFHFGDNVPLPEDGTYTVEVTLNPIAVRKTGAFEGRFEESETATFEFEWSRDLLEELRNDVEFLPEEEWGERGAIEPMNHGDHGNHGDGEGGHDDGHGDGHHDDNHDDGHSDGHGDGHGDDHGDAPPPGLPPADAYPGTDLGTHESGDAAVVVRYLSESPLAEEGDGYLLVSPRTPYNRIPLPDMSLSVSGLTENGATASLTQTLDDELGLHYGLSVTLSPGATFELGVDVPPQIARHQGYETAFLEMEPMEIEVPE